MTRLCMRVAVPEPLPMQAQSLPAARMDVERVVEAVSPTVDVERVDGGVQITVHDLRGDHVAALYDGQQGEQGLPGNDGYTPVKGVDYFDGQDGASGQTGADGFSPVATVAKSGSVATITITDATGTTTATVSDGAQGSPGPKGDPGEVTQAEFDALKDAFTANLIHDTATGAIANFPDGAALPVRDLSVDVEPVQAGSGDPSPTNVRPISGWTGTKVTVSPSQNAQDGTTYDITFPSEVGTVYGGTLDVTTGLLTVDRAMDEFDGSSDEAWRKFNGSSASAFAMFVPREHFHEPANKHIKANYLKTIAQPITWGDFDNWISANTSSGFVTGIKSITDVDLWKAYLSQNPLQVCYELATPQTHQLTPTEVSTLLGTNNIFADCGDSTVDYYADPTLYINRKIAAAVAAMS